MRAVKFELGLDFISECWNVVSVAELDFSTPVGVAGRNFERDVEELEIFLWCWDRKQHGHHRIKSNGDSVTVLTANGTLELAMEEIGYDWFVSQQVLVPSFFCHFLLTFVFIVSVGDVRLFSFSVQIFTHQVQDRVNALVRIMLTVATELGRVFSQNSFKEVRPHNLIGLIPHLIDQLCVSHYHTTFRAKRVLDAKLLNEVEPVFKEKPRQLVSIAQTLQAWSHITSIAQVTEPNESIACISWSLNLYSIEFAIHLCTAIWLMETFVPFKTPVITVAHAFANTLSFKLVAFVAPLTLTDNDPLLLLKLVQKVWLRDLN